MIPNEKGLNERQTSMSLPKCYVNVLPSMRDGLKRDDHAENEVSHFDRSETTSRPSFKQLLRVQLHLKV